MDIVKIKHGKQGRNDIHFLCIRIILLVKQSKIDLVAYNMPLLTYCLGEKYNETFH